MDSVIVVRIGDSHDMFNRMYSHGKWSSPESSSVVREHFLIGFNVYVIFCNESDCPLYITKIINVRHRHYINDANFPLEHPLGKFQIFMEFQPLQVININQIALFNKVKDYIQYKPGHQILINDNMSESIIAYYNGFSHGYSHAIAITQVVKEDVQEDSATYINQPEFDKMYMKWMR
jgi:hypothetical protein